MRGRKPDVHQAAKGHPGGRRKRHRAAEADHLRDLRKRASRIADDGAPAELTELGARLWRAAHDALAAMNLVRETDRQALARYADTLATYWEVTFELRTRSLVYDAPMTYGGTMRRREPLFDIQQRLGDRLQSFEDRLGLNIRARQELLYRMAQGAGAPATGELALDDAGAGAPAGDVGDPVSLFSRIETAGNA